jgi:hypothetical protein
MVMVRSAKSWIFQVRGKPGAEADPLSWNFQHLADAKILKFAFSPTNREKAQQHHPSKKITPISSTPCLTMPSSLALPLPDGSRTFSTRWEEGLSGFAVTCGEVRGEAEAIGVPLAGGRSTVQSQPPGRACSMTAERRGMERKTGAGLWRT